MAKLRKVPSKANKESVIKILETILEGFKTGDTLEFNLNVTLNFDGYSEEPGEDKISDTPWDVIGMMRYGQSRGQGFITMFNSLEEEQND